VHLVSVDLDPLLIDLDSPECVQHPTTQRHLTSRNPIRIRRIHILFMLTKNANGGAKDAPSESQRSDPKFPKIRFINM
jgi:hypothetical protein